MTYYELYLVNFIYKLNTCNFRNINWIQGRVKKKSTTGHHI